MSDILDRLKSDEQYQWRQIMRDAAAEIERLRGLLGSTTTPATGGAVIHLADHDVIIRVVPRKPEVQA